MSLESEVAELRAQLAALTREVGAHADVLAVRALQFKYGYYMDKCLFPAIVDLFADNATLYFLNGVFRGKRGAQRLYGGASGLNGPVNGLLFEHIIAQDIVDVAADGRTALGRFRCFMQGGVHQSKRDANPRLPAQFLEAGIYENEYVKDNGVWKILVFNYRIVYQARFEEGWAKSPIEPLMVADYQKTYPEDPRGPDELRASPPRWPQAVVQPFHYPHPVTGSVVKLEVS
ncbi:MAG TPA: nuclear transport factor 2 family protein [Steroidobacteraceae bacterium]|nr:nuclear transport factor 2 family protein [Steroidobacteraceae bacterium]